MNFCPFAVVPGDASAPTTIDIRLYPEFAAPAADGIEPWPRCAAKCAASALRCDLRAAFALPTSAAFAATPLNLIDRADYLASSSSPSPRLLALRKVELNAARQWVELSDADDANEERRISALLIDTVLASIAAAAADPSSASSSASTANIKTLQRAIDGAMALLPAGEVSAVLRDAPNVLATLKSQFQSNAPQQATAIERLVAACESRDIAELQSALTFAEQVPATPIVNKHTAAAAALLQQARCGCVSDASMGWVAKQNTAATCFKYDHAVSMQTLIPFWSSIDDIDLLLFQELLGKQCLTAYFLFCFCLDFTCPIPSPPTPVTLPPPREQRRQELLSAVRALQRATEAPDADMAALRAAISDAATACRSPQLVALLETANGMYRRLKEAQDAAVAELKFAVYFKQIYAVEKALDLARRATPNAQIDALTVTAMQLLSELKITQQRALHALTAAIASREVDQLAAAVAGASLACDSVELEKLVTAATALLTELQHAQHAAATALRVALSKCDLVAIDAAIAASLKVCASDELQQLASDGRLLVAACDRVRPVLVAALAGIDTDACEAAIALVAAASSAPAPASAAPAASSASASASSSAAAPAAVASSAALSCARVPEIAHLRDRCVAHLASLQKLRQSASTALKSATMTRKAPALRLALQKAALVAGTDVVFASEVGAAQSMLAALEGEEAAAAAAAQRQADEAAARKALMSQLNSASTNTAASVVDAATVSSLGSSGLGLLGGRGRSESVQRAQSELQALDEQRLALVKKLYLAESDSARSPVPAAVPAAVPVAAAAAVASVQPTTAAPVAAAPTTPTAAVKTAAVSLSVSAAAAATVSSSSLSTPTAAAASLLAAPATVLDSARSPAPRGPLLGAASPIPALHSASSAAASSAGSSSAASPSSAVLPLISPLRARSATIVQVLQMLPPSARLTVAELRAVYALLTRRVARMSAADDGAASDANAAGSSSASATGSADGALTLDQCDRETRIVALSESLADFLANDALTAALLRRLEACSADARQGYASGAFLARVRARAVRVDHEAAAEALTDALIAAGGSSAGATLESLDVLFASENGFCAHFVKVYGDARPTTSRSNRDPDGCSVM